MFDDKSDWTSFNCSENIHQDAYDRAAQELKKLETQNQQQKLKIQRIRNNPQLILQSIRNKLLNKIHKIKQENYSLKQLIQKSKYPGFAQMTKKKIVIPSHSPWKKNQSFTNSQQRQKDLFESEHDEQKYEVSTCLNYEQKKQVSNGLEPMSSQDNIMRVHLLAELHQQLSKYQLFKEELKKLASNQQANRNQISEENLSKLQNIYKYKKKLINLFKQLKKKQRNLQHILVSYRQMHENMSNKLQNTLAYIKQLEEIQVSEDAEHASTQIQALQKQLSLIKQELQEFNDEKWTQEILKQLQQALYTAKVQVPNLSGNVYLRIQQICDLLLQCLHLDESEFHQKLAMLQVYQQQENINQQQSINLLKQKQKLLNKKLLSMQLSHGK